MNKTQVKEDDELMAKEINTEEEFEEVLMKFKDSKIPGEDGIKIELFKYLGPGGKRELFGILNLTRMIKKISLEWSVAIILPKYKGRLA